MPLKHVLNYLLQTGRHPVGALDLAKWGFYYYDAPDASRCIFCHLEVRGWEQGDTAESEHRQWNPNCPFMSGRAVGNVKLGEEFSEENLVDDCAISITNIHSGNNKKRHILNCSFLI